MTEIEKGYEAQGFKLPTRWDWDRVAIERRKWDIEPIYVPICGGPGVAAWGVPIVNGKHLKHP